jgi:hypothetical protein
MLKNTILALSVVVFAASTTAAMANTPKDPKTKTEHLCKNPDLTKCKKSNKKS